MGVDPAERGQRRLAQPPDELVVAGPAPHLGEQHEVERGRVDRPVVAAEPRLGGLAAPDLVDDLPRLGIDRRVVLGRLQLGEHVERAAGEVRPEQERLVRGDQRVAPEDGHEPRHAGSRQPRVPGAAAAHSQRRQVGEGALERVLQCIPRRLQPRELRLEGLLLEVLRRRRHGRSGADGRRRRAPSARAGQARAGSGRRRRRPRRARRTGHASSRRPAPRRRGQAHRRRDAARPGRAAAWHRPGHRTRSRAP